MSTKTLTDRRQNVEQQIAFYTLQASLARKGLTDRPPEFFERQLQYFRMYGR